MQSDTHTQHYQQCTIETQERSQVRIAAEIPVDVVQAHRPKIIQKLLAQFELDGFRKGKVPESMMIEAIGEHTILMEIADSLLGKAYAEIVRDNELDVVGHPQVTVTKLAPENPIGFTILAAVYPTVVLSDYKKNAEKATKKSKDPQSIIVSDEEVQKELERLHGIMTQTMSEKDAKHGEDGKETNKEEIQPTPLDDAFAQSLGDFNTLDDLKKKIREGMELEKKQQAHEARRLAIVDAILSGVKVDLPEVFVEGEVEQMVGEFHERIARAGFDIEKYLEQIQKTEEGLKKEWRGDAEKRTLLQVVLAEIARTEGIEPDSERLEREVAHIKEHYPEAEEANIRSYAAAQMRNEAVFAMLEEGEKKEDKADNPAA
jgi:trigger factor